MMILSPRREKEYHKSTEYTFKKQATNNMAYESIELYELLLITVVTTEPQLK